MLHPILIKVVNSMPSFILRPISKSLTNHYLDKYSHMKVENEDKLSGLDGPVIFISNHLSNSDGLVLNRVLRNKQPYFVAGVKLSKNSLSRIGLEAVKTIQIRPNSADIEAMKKCIEKVKEGKSILIFPEGTRSRNGEMIEGKKGVLLIAKKCGVPLVPIGLTGTEKLLPINDKDMGKEVFNHADVRVVIGEPFEIPEKLKEEDKEEYNDRCLNIIMKNIAELLPEKYRGVHR